MSNEILRALKYKLLSLVFLYPNEELISKTINLVDDLIELDKDVGHLRSYLVEAKGSYLRDLRVEYTRLFINAYPTVPCAPYESFFKFKRLSEPNILASLKQFYSVLGYDTGKEATDHISTELEFMYLLILTNKLDKAKKVELSLQFMSKHLGSWVLDFTKCVKENAKLEYFRVFSNELEKFIKEEMSALTL